VVAADVEMALGSATKAAGLTRTVSAADPDSRKAAARTERGCATCLVGGMGAAFAPEMGCRDSDKAAVDFAVAVRDTGHMSSRAGNSQGCMRRIPELASVSTLLLEIVLGERRRGSDRCAQQGRYYLSRHSWCAATGCLVVRHQAREYLVVSPANLSGRV